MEHTKGPWKAQGPAIYDTNDYIIARAVACGLDQNDANARLIAQSPSMYDALAAIANMQTQETTEWWELATLCISIAKIEIAKLEGK